MSTMVERIEKALMEIELPNGKKGSDVLLKEEFHLLARAAIEAMEAPSPSMTGAISMSINADQVWRTMIQAALKEEAQ